MTFHFNVYSGNLLLHFEKNTFALHLLFVNKNRLHRNYTKVLKFYIKYCLVRFQQQILYQIWVISTFLCIGKPINSNSQAISSRKFIFMIMAINFLYLWLISISYIKVNFFSFYCLKINCRSQYNTYKCQEYMDTFWQDPVYSLQKQPFKILHVLSLFPVFLPLSLWLSSQ